VRTQTATAQVVYLAVVPCLRSVLLTLLLLRLAFTPLA